MADGFAINQVVNYAIYLGMQVATAFIVSNDGLFRAIELESFALCPRTQFSDIVQTEHHVLRRNGDRCAIGRVKNVVALKHQDLCFEYGFIAQWEMDGHLVAIEVGIERRTSQRVQLNGLSFDEFGLESLYTQTVKCRRTVQHDGVTFHHVLKNIPDNRLAAVYNLLGTLHGLHDAALDELANDERFVEFGCHQLW